MASKEEVAALWSKEKPQIDPYKARYRVLQTPRSFHLMQANRPYALCGRYSNKGEHERVGIYKSWRAVRRKVTCPGCLCRMDEPNPQD